MTKQDQPWPVKIIRSKKRKKTVSASVQNGELVVRAPARMSKKELNGIIEKLQTRLQNKVKNAPQTDDALEVIAQQLNRINFLTAVSNGNPFATSPTKTNGLAAAPPA